MDKGWKDIQAQINQKEEPLSDGAWSLLESQLPKGKRKFAWWWLVLAVVVLIGATVLWPDPVVSNNTPMAIEPESKTEPIQTLKKPVVTSGKNQTSDGGVPIIRASTTKQAHAQSSQENEDVPEAENEENAPFVETTGQPDNEFLTTTDVSNKEQPVELVDGNTAESAKTNTEEEPATEEIWSPIDEEPTAQSTYYSVGEPEEEQKVAPITNNPFYRWELKAFGGLTYNSSNVIYSALPDFSHRDLETVSENGVQPGWGFDAGFEVSYYAWRFLKISSGIGLRSFETQNNLSYQVDDIPVIDSATGEILGYLPSGTPINYASSSTNQFTYLSIPLSLFYEHKLGQHWAITGEFVSTAQFLIQQNSQTINPTNLSIQDSKDDLFNTTVFTYQFRLGVRHYLNDQLAVAFEPAYRGYYNNIYHSEIITWRPTDWSLNLAVIYKLKLSKPKMN